MKIYEITGLVRTMGRTTRFWFETSHRWSETTDRWSRTSSDHWSGPRGLGNEPEFFRAKPSKPTRAYIGCLGFSKELRADWTKSDGGQALRDVLALSLHPQTQKEIS